MEHPAAENLLVFLRRIDPDREPGHPATGGVTAESRIIFLGEAGTGKTHLSTGLTVAACRQRLRVRLTTAAELVNELTEAKKQSELKRVTARWMRYELIVVERWRMSRCRRRRRSICFRSSQAGRSGRR